jgi:peptidyl-tRNA hydrolase
MDIDPVDAEIIDAEAADIAPSRPARHRMLPAIIISALVGAIVGGGVVYVGLMKPPVSQIPPALTTDVPAVAPAPGARALQTAGGSDWSSALSAAKRDTAAGKLREAQEEYLSILLIEPTHEEAMRGLVRVVGLIAKGNRAALRRQAEEYRRAISLGIETEEHYTGPAMEILARATLQAAGERVPPLSQVQAPAPSPPVAQQPRASPREEPRQTPRPKASSQPKSPPRPAATQPQSPREQTRPAPPAPPPSKDPAAATPAQPPEGTSEPVGPLTILQIGPAPGPLATDILGELTLAGFSARVSSQGGLQVFRVLSNRLPAEMAQRRAGELTALGLPARVRLLSGGFAQMDFGVYPSAEAAEAVASKVHANGVDASVVTEGGPTRLITVGPHPRSTIDQIVRSLRAKFGNVRLVVSRAE